MSQQYPYDLYMYNEYYALYKQKKIVKTTTGQMTTF